MSESPAQRATRAAREALNAAIRSSYDRRLFTIAKFGRHRDGYLHAQVDVDGKPYYFHCRYGSWLAPGQVGPRTVLKEPESLLGGDLGKEVKYALAEKSWPIEEAARRERARQEEEAKRRGNAASRRAEDGGVGDPAVPADRILGPGDSGHADESVQPQPA